MDIPVTQTYQSFDGQLRLYELTLGTNTVPLRQRLTAYIASHNYPDDAYLLNRAIFSAQINDLPSIEIDGAQYDVLTKVNQWANDIVTSYQATYSEEISEYERSEQRSLSEDELFLYATA